MPKAKHRDKDKRGLRFPIGKRRSDPWYPVPPIGSQWKTTDIVSAFWGSIGPNTVVKIVDHTPEATNNYGPGVKVLPIDLEHPIYKSEIEDKAIYLDNREVKTKLAPI